MSEPVFHATKPFMQSFLAKNTTEYHIYYTPEDDQFESAYLGTTGRHFMNDVYKFLISNFKDDLKKHGRDETYDEDGTAYYIWVHLDEASSKDIMNKILSSLEDKYNGEWRFHRVPKLVITLQSQLRNNSEYLANAVSHYQKTHGFQQTQDAIYTLFNHIKPNYTYWMHCDIESDDSDTESDD